MHKKKIGQGYLYAGFDEGFSLCCIFFFQDVWSGSNRKFFKEYCDTMDKLTHNRGLIMCPDCVVKTIADFSLRSELV